MKISVLLLLSECGGLSFLNFSIYVLHAENQIFILVSFIFGYRDQTKGMPYRLTVDHQTVFNTAEFSAFQRHQQFLAVEVMREDMFVIFENYTRIVP